MIKAPIANTRYCLGMEGTKASFGKNQRGTIKITELTEPSIYAFTTKTNRNTFSTRWELHKIDVF